MFAFFVFNISVVLAEGSKELAANGGNRAHLLSSDIGGEGIPFPTRGTVKVYAKAGERIYLGSSVSGADKIRFRAPNGGRIGFNPAGQGIIADRTEEVAGPAPNAGGYTPFIITVGANETGVWEIDFISPSPTTNPRPTGGAAHPTSIAVGDNWTQETDVSYVTAFDVSVRSAADEWIKGRAFMNIFGGTIGSFAGFNGKFHVLTNDGYIYEVTNKGQAGYVFSFFSNNKGFRDNAGNPIYKSINGATNPPVHDPRQNDTATDFTHKLFFNTPNEDLPATARTPAGSTWLRTPIKQLSVSDVTFEGAEGTPNQAGSFPLGGYFKFKTSEVGSYIITIDIDKNGVFTDAVDVRLQGATQAGGVNSVYWDGRNGLGVKVNGNFTLPPNAVNVSLRGGEVHFPFLDVEGNNGGIEIKRINGASDPDFTVYWDDSDFAGLASAPIPIKTSINGENSQTNGHKYGPTTASQNSYGNNKSLDTWAYLVSSPEVPYLPINFKESDLEVVSLSANKTTYCLGEEMTYTIVVKNNGPNDVVGAKFFFDYPEEFNITNISHTFSSNNSGNSTTDNHKGDTQFTSTLSLINQATVTYTFKVKLATSPAGGVITKASVMRPVDVTDPDATNPDNLPPTDPDIECNAGTVGCNNIKQHSGITFTGVTINMGTNQSVTEGTGGVKTISFPVTLSASSLCDISVDYNINHLTTVNADFLGATSGTLVIPAGQTSANIVLQIATDNIVERNEEFEISISSPSGVNTIDRSTAVGTIMNDDIGLINVTKADGYEEGAVSAKYIFSFANGVTSDCNLEIDYALSTTSARGNGVDYTGVESGTITINAGVSSYSLELPVIDDDIVEGHETIDIANITSIRSIRPENGLIQLGYDIDLNPTVPTVTIFDNDKATVRISDPITVNEGNAGFTDFVFNLTLDEETSGAFTLNFKTSDGTALVSDNDYEALNTVVNFSGTPQTIPVTVRVIGDNKIESDEYFHVSISDLSNNYNGNLSITQSASVGNIIDDDTAILDITSLDATEGGAAGQFIFTLRDNKVADADVTITYTLTGKAIGGGVDYDKTQTGTITLFKGQSVAYLYLNTYDDNLVEGTEDVILTVNSVSHTDISLATNTSSLNITDNNTASINVADVQVTEGNAGTTILRFKAVLNGRTDTDFTLPFTIHDVSTTLGTDYSINTISPISFSPNLSSQEINIELAVNGDYDIEGHETLRLALGTPSKLFNGNLVVQSLPAIGTILDDDGGQITVTASHGKEENEEPVVFTFAFPSGVTSTTATEITFSLAGSTATAGADYVAPADYKITIPPHTNSVSLNIPVEDDDVVEGRETIVLTPSPVVGNPSISINTFPVIAEIEDNDTGTITLTGPATVTEGDAGVNTVNYTVKLDTDIQHPLTLSYRTADVTAFAGEDYDGVLNTYTFLPGPLNDREIIIPVTVRGDRKIEADEAFRLVLNPLISDFGGRITISTPYVETVIVNDDDADIVIHKIDGIEGSQNARFSIGFDNGYSTDVPLNIPYTLSGTAQNPGDYTGLSSGVLTLSPGQSIVQLDLPVVDDNLVENTENVTINLSATALPYGIVFIQQQATLDIRDNDSASISISNASILEGNESDVYLIFDVNLTGADIQEPFSIPFSITDGSATLHEDYELPTSTTLYFNGAADRNKQIQVLVKGDLKIEKDETLQVTLGALSESFEGRLTVSNASATGTIVNNDKGSIQIVPDHGDEEGSVAGSFQFNFLNGVTSDEATTFHYTLSGSAQIGVDYTTTYPGSVTIPAGVSSVTVNIDVIDDAIIEPTETVILTTTSVSSPYLTEITVSNSPQSINISDNDVGQLLLTADPDVLEGAEGETTTVRFKVKLTAETASPFSVNYQFVDITATNGIDYIGTNGVLNFNGTADEEYEITASIIGDYKIEDIESFRLVISNPTPNFNGALSIPVSDVVFNIKNDDSAQLTISKQDGEEGGNDGYFRISLPVGYTLDRPVNINYSLSGSAVSGQDFAALPGAVTLPANTNTIDIPIAIIDDAKVEGDEFVTLTANITTPIYEISFVDNTNTLKIADNDLGTVSINNVSVGEEDSGEHTLSFDVVLNTETETTFNLIYKTEDGTALAGEDYEAIVNGIVTFGGAKDETRRIQVKYYGDKKIEADESFRLVLQSLSTTFGGHLSINSTANVGTATLRNDDQAVVSVSADHASETGTRGVFRFYLENGATADKNITLTYTLGGTALNTPTEKDYHVTYPTTVTIPAGQNYVDVELTIVDDDIVEGTETVELENLQLFSDYSSELTLSATIPVLNIMDNDDAEITIQAPDEIIEGDSGTKQYRFTVKLEKETAEGFTVNYTIADGTAQISDGDYVVNPVGTLIFLGEEGEEKYIDVQINGDQKIEPDEDFTLTLSNPSMTFEDRLTIPVKTKTGIIKNDDLAEIIITKQDGAEGGQAAAFIFTLSNSKTVDEDIFIEYSLDNLSAIAGTDFTVSQTSPLLLPKGSNSVTLTLNITDDNIVEGTETVEIKAETRNNPRNNISIDNPVLSLNIADNDEATLSVQHISKDEGNDNTTVFTFAASLNKVTQKPFTVKYSTVDETAVSGEDFQAAVEETLVFSGLSLTPQTFTVQVRGDRKIEADEVFRVLLHDLSTNFEGRLHLPATAASGTILNDDSAVISISGTNGEETDQVPGTFTFRLPSNVTVDKDIVINYTLAGTATGNGVDYANPISGTITIPANQSEAVLNIQTKDDDIVELNESVILNASISNNPYPARISLSTNTQTIFIEDNDTATLTLTGTTTVTEGNSGLQELIYTVTLDKPTTAGFNINYSTLDVTARSSDEDYQASAGTLHFDGIAAGEHKTFSVFVKGDIKLEGNESFKIVLNGLDNNFNNKLTIANAETEVTIQNDDTAEILITKQDGKEAPGDNEPGAFKFSLPPGVVADRDIVLNYSLGGSAMGGGLDYNEAMVGQVTILAGDNEAVLDITVKDDALVEGNETVELSASIYSGPATVSLDNTQSSLTIFDDDYASISISPVSKAEGNTDNNFVFSVTLNKETKEAFTLNYRTADGTAIAGEDYTAIPAGTLSFDGQPRTLTIPVQVKGDKLVELDEQFFVELLGLNKDFNGHLSISSNRVSATILNDDTPDISIIPSDGDENGLVAGKFRFKFDGDYTSSTATVITYHLGGSAGAGQDFSDSFGGTISIPAGGNYVDLLLPVIQDEIVEGNEEVIINAELSSALAAISFPIKTSTLNILDDDTAEITLAVDEENITEGNAGTKSVTFFVTLDKATKTNFTLNYRTEDITALATEDYEPTSGQLAFSGTAGEEKQVTVNIKGDRKIEADELFKLVLFGLSKNFEGRLSVVNPEKNVTIQNDDSGSISITHEHGVEGSEDGEFIFSLPEGITADQPVTIHYKLTGTAGVNTDYTTPAIGTVHINPGESQVVLPITLVNDNVLELDETVALEITNIISANGIDAPVKTDGLTISDDDTATITLIAPTPQTEKDSGEETVSFIVRLDKPISQNIALPYTFEDETAIHGIDYSANNGTVNFLTNLTAGQDKLIEAKIIGDKSIEADEVFNVLLGTLSQNFGGRLTIQNSKASYTILNDDSGTIHITASHGAEGGTQNPGFRFELVNGNTSDQPITLNFTLEGTANGSDYSIVSNAQTSLSSVTIPAGQTYADLEFNVIDDEIVEPTETIQLKTLSIAPETSYWGVITLSPSRPTIQIADNDAAELQLTGLSKVAEGDEGVTKIVYELALSKSTQEAFTIKLAAQDGTARQADNDYLFLARDIVHSGDKDEVIKVEVDVIGDRKIEASEGFEFNIVSISNNFEGRLTYPVSSIRTEIENDDTGDIVITAKDGEEASANNKPGVFTFSLPAGITVDEDVIINYSLSGTASNADYPPVSGQVTIPANSNSADVQINVIDDDIVEGEETLVLTASLQSAGHGIKFKDDIRTSSLKIADNDYAYVSINNVSVQEQHSGTHTLSFDVSIDKEVSQSFKLYYRTEDLTANAGEDYTAVAAGEKSINRLPSDINKINITYHGDRKVEADEVFRLLLTGVENLFGEHLKIHPTQHTGLATLVNDDQAKVKITAVQGAEDGTQGKAVYRFTLVDHLGNEVSADKPVTVRYNLAGSANLADYRLNTALDATQIVIPAGQSSAELVFQVIDDEIVEGTETIVLQNVQVIADYAAITLDNVIPVLEIKDNDVAKIHVLAVESMAEGDDSEADYIFTVRLDKATSDNFTVNYHTENITATAGEDYIAVTDVLNFRGEANEEYQIQVKIKGDHVVEPDETFRLVFSDPSNHFSGRLTFPGKHVVAKIENDDFTAIEIIASKGKEGLQDASFTFKLRNDKTVHEDLLINYTLDNVSAKINEDYTVDLAQTSPLKIAKGSNSVTLVLDVNDDNLIEGTEQVVLNASLANSSVHQILFVNSQAIAEIEDNDDGRLSISDVNITEGDLGTKDLVFTVSLGQPTQEPFTVKYSTADGTAVAGEDYTSVQNGILSFDKNTTTQTIRIKITGDKIVEDTEEFYITLADLSSTFGGHLSLPLAPATGTIVDNDLVKLSITGADGKERGPVNGQFVFRILEGYAADKSFTVDYSLGGEATAGTDYSNSKTGTITFEAGETEKILQIEVIDDSAVEHDESIILNATLNSIYPQVSLNNHSASIKIEDNDAAIITLEGTSEVVEGKDGYREIVYTVTLGQATHTSFTIDYFTEDGSATVTDEDYLQANGTLSFAGNAGEQQTFKVFVKGDEKVEADETFKVGIRNGNIGNLAGRLQIMESPIQVTIKNDDAANIVLTKIDGEEAADLSKPAQFIFSLEGNATLDRDLSIPYNLSTNSAQGNSIDYEGNLNGTVSIPAGQQSTILELKVLDDDIVEGTETVTLNVVNPNLPVHVTLVNPNLTLSILDNDEASISIDDVSVQESNNGTVNMEFTLSIDKATQNGFWINYSTEDITAKAGEDYQAVASGTINFNALSANSEKVNVTIIGDTKVEADETFRLILQSLNNNYEGRVHLPATAAIGTILNDDELEIAISGTDGREAESVKGTFKFTLVDGVTSDKPITIKYTLGGEASANGVDYNDNPANGRLIIPAGEHEGTVFINVLDDNIIEEREDIIIYAEIEQNPYPADINLEAATHTIYIEDNDSGVVHILGPANIIEGSNGSQILQLEVQLSKPTSKSFTVDYETEDGTATLADNDYQKAAGKLSFSGTRANETVFIPVAINGDTKVEADEYFKVLLSNLSETFNGRLRITGSPAIANIIDDDNLEINKSISIRKQDGEEGLSDAAFIFSFPDGIVLDTDTEILFDLGGSATIAQDYTINGSSSSIIIEAGRNSATLRLQVADDDIVEDTEQVDLVVSRVVNQKYTDVKMEGYQSSLSISDNDYAEITAKPRSIAEGNGGSTDLIFSLRLDKQTSGAFNIKYHTEDGTALISDNDYLAVDSEVHFKGEANEIQEIRIPVIGDHKIEKDEYFNLILSQLSNSFNNRLSLDVTTLTGTIENDDHTEIIVTRTDGAEGGLPVTFTFTLENDVTADKAILIDYAMTSESTAIGNGVDYMGANSGTVTINPGEKTYTLTLPVVDDELIEDDEVIVLRVNAVRGDYANLVAIPTENISAKIIDNDIARLRILGPVSVVEGDMGVAEVKFKVTLYNDTGNPFSVDFSTLDGTAKVSDDDYIPKSDKLSFAGLKGESKEIIILVNGDRKIEGDEDFFVELHSLSNNFNNRLVIETGRATAIVVDDDNIEANKVITISKADGAEGGSDVVFTFRYPSNVVSDYPTRIPYALTGALGNGLDYEGTISGEVIIPVGENQAVLRLKVVDDEIVEGTEIVELRTGNVTNENYGAIAVSNPIIQASILDNDYGIIRIEDAQIAEGDLATQEISLQVHLDKATGEPFTINYKTEDGNAKVADDDYVAVSNATISFAGHALESQTIKITVKGDKKIEADEVFDVVLTALSKTFEGRLSIQKNIAHATILNDDNAEITITGLDGAEAGTIPARFRFNFPAGYTSDIPTVVNYTLGGTATAGDVDYKGSVNGVFAIPANAESAILELPVIDDEIIEDDETISISVNSVNTNYPSNISVNADYPILKIADNDFTVLRLSSPISQQEGDNGTTVYTFSLTLEKETGGNFTVNYTTKDGTATLADNDYVKAAGSLSFAGKAGETQTVTVQVNGDQKIEGNEDFKFKVFGLSNTFNNRLTIPVSELKNTIQNDDSSQITITKVDGIEGMQDGRFIFSLDPGVTSDKDIVVHYRLSGTATASDYNASPSATSIIIPAGERSATLDIKVVDDSYLEERETVVLTVTNIVNPYNNVSIALPIPIVEIYDNDISNLTVSSPTPVLEGHSGTQKVVFKVTLDRNTDKAFTLNYSTVDKTATVANKDYNLERGRLSFAGFAGETKTIEVTVNGDIALEGDETFELTLSGLSPTFDGKLVLGPNGVATILNDDVAPIAGDDLVTTLEDTAVTFSLTQNDTHADGIDVGSIAMVSSPSLGKVEVHQDGTVTYSPNQDLNGFDTFTYTVKDIFGRTSNIATVNINIIPVNDAPVAVDDIYYVQRDSSIRENVSLNDYDVDGDVLSFAIIDEPVNGKIEFFDGEDGSFIYVPQPKFKGLDSFTYNVYDREGLRDTATVTLYVQPKVRVDLSPSTGLLVEGDSIRITAKLDDFIYQDVNIVLDFSGTAEINNDYILSGNYDVITIPAGDTATVQKFHIQSIRDYLKEGDETIEATIIATDPSEFVTIGSGADIILQDFYPEDKTLGPDENADINPDPLMSPNGDGAGNEVFVIYNIERYQDNEVVIYNRWGNEVYRIKGYNNKDVAFSGTANTGMFANKGEPLVDGVYFYMIHTKNAEGKPMLNKGYVIMRR